MSAFKDLTGMKFGRLTVIEFVGVINGRAYFKCRCDCGNIHIVSGRNLKSGEVKSCGCLRKEKFTHTTHGLKHSKYYNIWQLIKRRCYNPNCKEYPNYGGRGITVYEPWINDFQAFYNYISTLEHFGEKGYSLDRENNDGNYEPGNLRWATRAEQARNRRSNVIVEYQGEKMTLTEAAEKSGINRGTLNSRYYAGDTGDELFRPVKK